MTRSEARADNIVPPADVAPVRHGRWIDLVEQNEEYEDTYKCSACGDWFILYEGTPQEHEYYYCPHCGAKMDGEARKNDSG